VIGLLDTHALIWLDQDHSKLSAPAAQFIQDPGNDLVASVVSAWELVIKVQTGKLQLPDPVAVLIARQAANGVRLMGVELSHVLAVETLPNPHRDPFDRILAAQAIVEGAILITNDKIFQQYPATVVW
jgi:PIN domain nuclease of toxin-antitoxin system